MCILCILIFIYLYIYKKNKKYIYIRIDSYKAFTLAQMPMYQRLSLLLCLHNACTRVCTGKMK